MSSMGWVLEPDHSVNGTIEDNKRLKPVKPSLPPILLVGLSFWISSAISYSNFADFTSVEIALVVAGSLFLLVILSITVLVLRSKYGNKHTGSKLRFNKYRVTYLILSVLFGLCFGLLRGIVGLGEYTFLQEKYIDSNDHLFTVQVNEDPQTYSNRYIFEARILSIDGVDLVGRHPKIRMSLKQTSSVAKYGYHYVVSGHLAYPSSSSVDRLRESSIVGTMTPASFEQDENQSMLYFIYRARDSFCESLALNSNNNAASAVLAAVVCGNRTELNNSDTMNTFRVCGMGHLVAVSGAHLMIVSSLISVILSCFSLNKRLQNIIQMLIVLAFVVFSAVPISAVRAALMVYCCLVSIFFKRRPASINAIGLCAFFIILIDISAALSVSFVLSVLSTLGIVLFNPLILYWVQSISKRLPFSIASSISMTLSACLVSLPIGAAYFSQVSLISLIANVVISPLFTLMCVCGIISFFFAALLPAISSGMIFLALGPTRVVCFLTNLFADIPYACVPASISIPASLIFVALVSGTIYFFWPSYRRFKVALFASLLVASSVVFVLCNSLFIGTRVVMLDVGQGDSILIQSGGKNILIDTGTEDTLLKKALARNAVFNIDALFITHPDDDHCGSIKALTSVCSVRTICFHEDLKKCDSDSAKTFLSVLESCDYSNILYLQSGENISIGNVSLKVIAPKKYADEGGNDDSLVMVLKTNDDSSDACFSMLLCGDLEAEGLEKLTRRIGDIDVIKIGHHGSKVSVSETLLEKIDPEVALISVGSGNRYGHPSQATLEMLDDSNIITYRTDLSGDLTCRIFDDSYSITVQK